MASDNKLELVIEVEADKANARIKGVNQRLAGVEGVAVSVAKNASEGIDGMTASMVKGSLAGNLLAEAIKGAAESVKGCLAGAVEMAAHTERLPRLRIADCGFRIADSKQYNPGLAVHDPKEKSVERIRDFESRLVSAALGPAPRA